MTLNALMHAYELPWALRLQGRRAVHDVQAASEPSRLSPHQRHPPTQESESPRSQGEGGSHKAQRAIRRGELDNQIKLSKAENDIGYGQPVPSSAASMESWRSPGLSGWNRAILADTR